MSNSSACAFCELLYDLEYVQRVVRLNDDPIMACPTCRQQVYFELAIGQFFNNQTRDRFKRNLQNSRYLPRQYETFLRYYRLLEHATRRERYEDAAAYQQELDQLSQRFGIFQPLKLETDHQQEKLFQIFYLEDYLIAVDNMGEDIHQYPVLKLLHSESITKINRLKKELESEFQAKGLAWEMKIQSQVMQQHVEGVIRRVFDELKTRVMRGETSWHQIAQFFSEPVAPVIRAFLTDEIKELPEDFWKFGKG